ncbi:hypothetical protein ABT084_07085, partial [Streptomyces sp. NPDC002138]
MREALGGALEAALRGLELPPGRWCLPRLDLVVALDLGRSDPALGRSWAEAVAAGIEATVRAGRPGTLVHYRHDGELLADVVAGLASGRTDRLWAWLQTGVLRSGDPSPLASPGAAILAALDRHPRQIPAALPRAAEQCGVAALDRALGSSGWQRLAARLAPDAAWTAPPAAATTPGAPPPQAARVLAATLVAGSPLAALITASRLRPTAPVCAAWAVLIVADTAPALLRRPPPAGLPQLLAGHLRLPGGASAERRGTDLRPPDPGIRPTPAPDAATTVPTAAPPGVDVGRPGSGAPDQRADASTMSVTFCTPLA